MNKRLLTWLTAAGLACTPLLGLAQEAGDYPNKAIRVLIPLAAGSAVDNGARVLGQRMSTELGQSLVIENAPGSAGLIGADRFVKAAPDGYTIAAFNDSILTMVPNIYKTSWDPLTDFAPVSLVGTIEWGIVVKADSPYKSIGELIAAAKAKPMALNFGTGGNGSPQHLAMAMLSQHVGMQMTHVPYRGATPAAIAAAAGEVDVSFQGLGTVTSLIGGGKLRLLAVSTRERLPQYPDVPTLAEAGVPDFLFDSWIALVAPKGTPRAIIDRLYRAVQVSVADREVAGQLTAQGLTLRALSPDDFAKALKTQYARYKKVIEDNKIKAD